MTSPGCNQDPTVLPEGPKVRPVASAFAVSIFKPPKLVAINAITTKLATSFLKQERDFFIFIYLGFEDEDFLLLLRVYQAHKPNVNISFRNKIRGTIAGEKYFPS
jgi:hypothetical protein